MRHDPQPGDSLRRLVLVRHGRSAHLHTGWVDIHGFRRWREAYEAAALREGERPPAELVALGASADLVVSSDAPRAVASARLLAVNGPVETSPLLRELDLEAPALGTLRMPLFAWAVAVGARSALLARRERDRRSAETQRILAAATWLDQLSASRPTTVAVTHASLRRRLWKELLRLGWRPESSERSWAPWSAWTLHRPRCPGPDGPSA